MPTVLTPAELQQAKAAGKGAGLTNLIKRLVISGDMYLDLFEAAPEIVESKTAVDSKTGEYNESKLVRAAESTIERLAKQAIVDAVAAGTTSTFPALSVGVHDSHVLVINDDKVAEEMAAQAAAQNDSSE